MISRRSFFGALAVAPLAAVKAEAEPQQGVTVSIGVDVSDEGKMRAYVEEVARRSTRAGIAAYDRQLDREFPARLRNASERHL